MMNCLQCEIAKLLAAVEVRVTHIAQVTQRSDVQEDARTSADMLKTISEKFAQLIAEAKASSAPVEDKIIMKAKHLLMQRWHWSEDRAYKHIQRTAKSSRVKMKDLAAKIIEELTQQAQGT